MPSATVTATNPFPVGPALNVQVLLRLAHDYQAVFHAEDDVYDLGNVLFLARRLPNPYEQLKALTRGQGITEASMREFIATLDLPADARARLSALTPAGYVGLAERLALEI